MADKKVSMVFSWSGSAEMTMWGTNKVKLSPQGSSYWFPGGYVASIEKVVVRGIYPSSQTGVTIVNSSGVEKPLIWGWQDTSNFNTGLYGEVWTPGLESGLDNSASGCGRKTSNAWRAGKAWNPFDSTGCWVHLGVYAESESFTCTKVEVHIVAVPGIADITPPKGLTVGVASTISITRYTEKFPVTLTCSLYMNKVKVETLTIASKASASSFSFTPRSAWAARRLTAPSTCSVFL